MFPVLLPGQMITNIQTYINIHTYTCMYTHTRTHTHGILSTMLAGFKDAYIAMQKSHELLMLRP